MQLARINSFLAESLAGVIVIQVFGGQARSSRTFLALTKEYLSRSFGQIRVFGIFMPLTELMSSAAIALIVWYGGGEVVRS
ncbi:MAG: ABC transporter ATP-binding protein, partial [Chloroflexia bacterium]|nr:ABC transporter ATP-binding protein [Chloroflexia bacterium]